MRRIVAAACDAAGYMIFTAMTTAFIHIASKFEERDLK